MAGRTIGTVTIRYLAKGGCVRSIDDVVEHTNQALKAGRDAGPLRYDDFEIIAATFEGN